MKKLFSLIVIVIAFSSCSDEISMPAPGLQAFKDDTLWRAVDFKAYIYPDGHMRIVALAENEQLELNVSDTEEGSYYLASIDEENTAEFRTNFNDEVLNYLTFDGNGPILNINNPVLTAGTGYTQGFAVPTTSLDGGSGLTVNTTVNDNGAVTGVTINSPGIGYEPGDIFTVTGGNSNAKFKISSEVTITNFTEAGISGTFRFTAKNANFNPFANELVSFRDGSFYNIPIILVE